LAIFFLQILPELIADVQPINTGYVSTVAAEVRPRPTSSILYFIQRTYHDTYAPQLSKNQLKHLENNTFCRIFYFCRQLSL